MLSFVKCVGCAVVVILLIVERFEMANAVEILEEPVQQFHLDQLLGLKLPPKNTTYDFIIVGAGPAGCVLANRLSENPNWTVYLLEAGATEGKLHDIPAYAPMLQQTESNWKYKSIPQKHACFGMNDNECSLPRGKVLGGSSSINFMIYSRGNKRDFDRWVDAGNYGWSYEEVLPYFLRSEMSSLEGLSNSPYHNKTGLLSVEDVKFRTELVHAFVRGAVQAGHNYTDYNGEQQLGVSYVQANTLRGHRHSASKAFLKPIQNKRRNLHVLINARVLKILIDPQTKTAYGVDFLYNQNFYTVKARKEVILCSGVYNSPQLLMLSGIGPKSNLQSLGIPLVHELPVGQHLYDHMTHFGPTFTTNTTGQSISSSRVTPKDVVEFVSGSPSTVLSSIGAVESLAFIRTPKSEEPPDVPDIEFIMIPTSFASHNPNGLKKGANIRDDVYDKVYKTLEDIDHFTIIVLHLLPKSTGKIWLQNSDPFTPPKIDPNYLSNADDVEVILEGIKQAIKISKSPAMQSLNATIHAVNVPGCEELEFGTDDYWRCSIRVLSFTFYHQMSTCEMGPASDVTSVVDPQFKVHGIRRLRVVDTSVIPFPSTSHPNALSCMFGEKSADMIKIEWSCHV